MTNPMSFNSRGTCWNCNSKSFKLITNESYKVKIVNGKMKDSSVSDIEEYMICENCGEKFEPYKIGQEFYPASPLKEKLGIPQFVIEKPEYKFNNPFYKENE